ncbi:HD domain-containing protein [Phytoactinopolyspora halotolerans]|uniref:Metal-dependent phosphohydrolase n=1 Tax=Phytoactinopolyspora halotolerans TaxID=1981512 RepID=A0A6L9S4K0_9ACTN|nr:metal-dependent phosphohydrolase [Phytoactinopolyspora halotolerans]NED98949.1 metal-dependent phosphohydrolase [Phytoactinopolyspora halotolerans]
MHSWTAVAGPTEAATAVGRDLVSRWSEPHRHYHGLRHLRAVLAAIDMLADEARTPDDVRLAAWFHDAVYDGRPGDDEHASAALAERHLSTLALARPRIDEVVRLVLVTIDHDPAPTDANGAVLCDADLSVLAGTPEEYREYTDAVRRDYSHVADPDFRAGRAAVVDRLLGRDRLFHTAAGHARWEEAARRNLGAELTRLCSPHPPT